jgi:predicted O-linked N-acetylglucosamine transferase (SPINDLY family)
LTYDDDDDDDDDGAAGHVHGSSSDYSNSNNNNDYNNDNDNNTDKPSAERRIRIGFLSSFFYQHSVGRLLGNVIMNLNKLKYEIFVIELLSGASFRQVNGIYKYCLLIPNI